MKTRLCLFRTSELNIKLGQFLKKDMGLSHQFIKKFSLSRSYLEKEFFHKDEIEVPLDLINKDKINPLYTGPSVDTLYEDDDFLALNKPCGVHLHPLIYSDQLNLLSYLRANDKNEVLGVASQRHEKGWLYRLDRETSGVVVAAKNQATYELYRKKFSNLVKQKTYLCLVQGESCHLEGHYSLFYGPYSKKGAFMRASYDQARGQRGNFYIQKLISDGGYHLLKVELETGLRHQIRSGLKFLGFPILGDELYGGEKAPRLMLHAFEYRLCRELKEDLVLTAPSFLGLDSFLDLDSLFKVLHK